MKITTKHMRKVKMCVPGAREFAKRHGLDWKDFVLNGVEEEVLLSTGDAMAKNLVEVANGRK